MTFEHRHENKSCSACPSDQHKHLTYDSMTNNHKPQVLSLDMKTKVVQHVLRISIMHLTASQHDKESLLSLHMKTKVVVTETVTVTETFGSQLL